MKPLVYTFAIAAIALLAWQFNDPSLTRKWLAHVRLSISEIQPGGPAHPQSGAPAGPNGVHKCKVGTEVVYTDAPCAAAGHEQTIQAGTVTVVKGQRPAISAPSLPASAPNVRTLLVDPAGPSIMDKQIERATR